jgi:hypothetical protein
MNPMTGELRMFRRDEVVPDEFEKIPAMLRREAMLALEGKRETVINTTSDSKLAHWAKNRSKEKRKAKLAAASRRKNRK